MANKYVQITATGTYADKNNRVYEATGDTVSGWTEYMYYTDDYAKEYIYVSKDNVRAASTVFGKATTTPSVNFNAAIKRYPEPNLDIFLYDTGYTSQIYTNTSVITSSTYITLNISQQGTYAIVVNNSAATGVVSLVNSSKNSICINAIIKNGKQGFAVTMYPGTYYLSISVNGSTAVNLPANSLKVVKLNNNLCITNGMWTWLNPIDAIDDQASSEHYTAGLSFGSPAANYMNNENNSYETLPTGTISPAINPIVPSVSTVTNKLHTVGEYFYCPTFYKAYIFNKGLLYDTIATQRGVSLTDSVSKLNNTRINPPVAYYYYDIPVWEITLSVPAQATMTVPIVKVPGYLLTSGSYDTTNISQRSSITLHTTSGSNSVVNKPNNGFLFSSPLPSLSAKTTYFAIEMALKNASGRILRIQPVGGNLWLNINGVTVSYNFSTNSWISYTSPSNSQRTVWYNNSVGKGVIYVNGYTVSSGYITITNAKYTVYGSSGTYTTTSYNGTYSIYSSTTAGGVAFTVKEYSNISKGHAGFQILSGF